MFMELCNFKKLSKFFLSHLELFLIMTIFIQSSKSFATVEVAFFQVKDEHGKIYSSEPGGQFYHSAVKTDMGWVEVHVYYGVHVATDNIYQRKEFTLSLINNELPGITESQVKEWLGKPFDYTFNWSTQNSSYCSKLVANLLDPNILPLPFQSSEYVYPSGKRIKYSDTVGLSPDDLYKILLEEKNFKHFKTQSEELSKNAKSKIKKKKK